MILSKSDHYEVLNKPLGTRQKRYLLIPKEAIGTAQSEPLAVIVFGLPPLSGKIELSIQFCAHTNTLPTVLEMVINDMRVALLP